LLTRFRVIEVEEVEGFERLSRYVGTAHAHLCVS
jgi:hypothetical protein